MLSVERWTLGFVILGCGEIWKCFLQTRNQPSQCRCRIWIGYRTYRIQLNVIWPQACLSNQILHGASLLIIYYFYHSCLHLKTAIWYDGLEDFAQVSGLAYKQSLTTNGPFKKVYHYWMSTADWWMGLPMWHTFRATYNLVAAIVLFISLWKAAYIYNACFNS